MSHDPLIEPHPWTATLCVAGSRPSSSVSNNHLSGTDFEWSGSSHFGTILQDRAQDTRAQLPTRQAVQVVPRRRGRLTDKAWNFQKDRIQDLYIEKNYTLEKTMEDMQSLYQFEASPKQYKDKLKQWGFFKNLKREVVREIVEKTGERQGLQTEIRYQGRPIELERVKRSYDRLPPREPKQNSIEPQTSVPGVVVQTPKDDLQDEGSSHSNCKKADLPFTTMAQSPFDADACKADGQGLPLSELMKLKTEGARLVSAGYREKAVYVLQPALSGLLGLFTSTNDDVVETAWCLADAYIADMTTARAYLLLNWLSSNYSSTKGMWHPSSLAHYLRIVEMLQQWQRPTDALHVGRKIFTSIEENMSPEKFVDVISIDTPDDIAGDGQNAEAIYQMLMKGGPDDQIDQKLRLAKIWAAAWLPGMSDVLIRWAAEVRESTSCSRGSGVDVICIAIRHLVATGDHTAATEACKQARDELAKLIKVFNSQTLQDLLRLSRELASLHLQNKDPDGQKTVSRWTKDTVSRMIQSRGLTHGLILGDVRCFATHLAKVALDFQRSFGWDGARRWIEMALGLSSRLLGRFDYLTLDLERALRLRTCDIVACQGDVLPFAWEKKDPSS